MVLTRKVFDEIYGPDHTKLGSPTPCSLAFSLGSSQISLFNLVRDFYLIFLKSFDNPMVLKIVKLARETP